ncbi:MAG: M20 family metallo-hydrolase [Defluviicoccus sp.]|nr:M20 family metallo-hydrolase [Defluviicoccus sp.]
MGEGNGIAARVDGGRLWRRLMEMAEIGAIPGNGVNRQALSDEDIAARELLVDWARRRGYAVAVDDAANLFIRRPGGDPELAPVLTGSHMDSQPRGGRFDGIYGVIAGLEAIEAIDDAGAATRRPIELVAWTNEEGSRFDPGCMGSMVFSGAAPLERFEDALDANGISFGRALARTLSAAPDLPRRNGAALPAAYVEAHIEQGPVLEAASVPIGAVTGVQGSQRFVVEIGGATAHAGTAPVKGRRDALQAALRAVARLNEAMTDSNDVLRFTVGRFEVTPNSPNTVPSKVVFSIDLPSLRMPSGANHDAAFVASVSPTAMIFIPCLRGISHHESEYASPEDCAAGAKVLAETLCALADR